MLFGEKWYNLGSMSRKRKTKKQRKVRKTIARAEKPEIVISEVELGGTKLEQVEKNESVESGVLTEGGVSDAVLDEGVDLDVAEEETDLDAVGDETEARATGIGKGVTEKPGRKVSGGKLHRINVRYPWLKFLVVLVLAVGILLGGFEVGQVIGDTIWETTSDGDTLEGVTGDRPEGTDPNTEIAEKPTEGSEDKAAEENPEEKPAEEQPAVTVPVTNGKKLVALTFDDGPSTVTTGRLLDILKAKGVKATFFVVGSMASRAPDLLKRGAAEGHEIGSHSSYHQDLSKLGAADLQADVANMDRIFTEVLGRNAEIVRPPYGAVSDIMRGYLGKPMIYWSVDPMDWKYRDAATVRANVVGATYDGAIVLMHDIYTSTVDAVAGIIDDLRAQGYEFLTVSELAAVRGVGLTSGVVYYNFRP